MAFLTHNNGSTFIVNPTNQNGSFLNSQIRFGGFGTFTQNIIDVAISGKLLIGTTSSAANFHLSMPIPTSGNLVGMVIDANSFNSSSQAQNSFLFRVRGDQGGVRHFSVRGDGKVGIGTTCFPADAQLAVNKIIYATAVKISLTNGSGCFPDYVFAKDYYLRPLKEVEEYIEEHSHLPEVPSAAEVEENGIDVAAMNVILLKKIEELTLYMIQLEKKVEKLENR